MKIRQGVLSCLIALVCLGMAALVVMHLRPGQPSSWYAIRRADKPMPVRTEMPAPAMAATGPVSVNTAGLDELITIPGIGPVTAQAIIDEREQNGRFSNPQDLLCVRGIGEKTLLKLLPYVNLD